MEEIEASPKLHWISQNSHRHVMTAPPLSWPATPMLRKRYRLPRSTFLVNRCISLFERLLTRPFEGIDNLHNEVQFLLGEIRHKDYEVVGMFVLVLDTAATSSWKSS